MIDHVSMIKEGCVVGYLEGDLSSQEDKTYVYGPLIYAATQADRNLMLIVLQKYCNVWVYETKRVPGALRLTSPYIPNPLN